MDQDSSTNNNDTTTSLQAETLASEDTKLEERNAEKHIQTPEEKKLNNSAGESSRAIKTVNNILARGIENTATKGIGVALEGAKVAVATGIQAVSNGGIKSTASYIGENVISSASSFVTQDLVAAELGVGVATGIAAATGLAGVASLSIISAYASSNWKTLPKEDENEEFKREVAEKGKEPCEYNIKSIMQPQKNASYEPKSKEFQEFMSKFELEINLLIEDNEVQKWFE